MEGKNLFTLIPRVDDILDRESTKELLKNMPRKIVLDSIRSEIDEIRNKIKSKILDEIEIIKEIENIELKIKKTADEKNSYKLKRVINATGVVIHTNLGRSLISKKIMEIRINKENKLTNFLDKKKIAL